MHLADAPPLMSFSGGPPGALLGDDDVEQLIDLPAIQTILQTVRDWLFREVLVVSTLVQLVVVAATFAVAQMAANGFRRFVAREI